jgi:prepilin-type processing-associated H-X9-DG protein
MEFFRIDKEVKDSRSLFPSLFPSNFLFADGSSQILSYAVAPIMPRLATRAGGEVVTLP